jgi:SAM-dependent methyltransferase
MIVKNSRELGLVLAQQLLGVDDLHYGLWDDDLPVTLANLASAQQHYTDHLLAVIDRQLAGIHGARILDVGCGTGHLLLQLRSRGHRVDAVSPSAALNHLVRERLAQAGATDTRLFECRFEDLAAEHVVQPYDLVLFSESFQYVALPGVFVRLRALLVANGRVMICDFFRTAAHGRGGPGDRTIGGGHDLEAFERERQAAGFTTAYDEDLTARVSPTIDLLDTLLRERLVPAVTTLDDWLSEWHPRKTRLVKWLWHRRLARLRDKYLSGSRTGTAFATYKTYRLLVLQPEGAGSASGSPASGYSQRKQEN